MQKNGEHVFYRCEDCNYLHLGIVATCCKCFSANIIKEVFDELPLSELNILSEEDKITDSGAVCSFCGRRNTDYDTPLYEIVDRSKTKKRHIYCPTHYLMLKIAYDCFRGENYNDTAKVIRGN